MARKNAEKHDKTRLLSEAETLYFCKELLQRQRPEQKGMGFWKQAAPTWHGAALISRKQSGFCFRNLTFSLPACWKTRISVRGTLRGTQRTSCRWWPPRDSQRKVSQTVELTNLKKGEWKSRSDPEDLKYKQDALGVTCCWTAGQRPGIRIIPPPSPQILQTPCCCSFPAVFISFLTTASQTFCIQCPHTPLQIPLCSNKLQFQRDFKKEKWIASNEKKFLTLSKTP